NDPNCVPLLVDQEEAEAQALACDAVCSDPNKSEEQCRAACEDGVAAPPLPGSTCSDVGGVTIRLDAFIPQECTSNAECAPLSPTSGNVARECAVGVECLDVQKINGQWQGIACENNSQCANGRCNLDKGFCTNVSHDKSCDTQEGDACVGHCYTTRGCGVRP